MATKPASSAKPAKSTAKPLDPKAPALTAVADEGDADLVKSAETRLKDLVERIVETSGAKRKDVKQIVDATLAEIDKALAKGEVLNLPGLGKLRVVKAASEAGGAMTLKLRKHAGGEGKANSAKDALAGDDE